MNRILKEKQNCWKILPADSSGLLIDARDYFKAIYEAMSQARKNILMTGWRFDSDVRLLRGRDAEGQDTDVRLLPYLNSLCEKNPQLNVCILAWDHPTVMMLDREWGQAERFNQSESGQIHFKFDSRHAIGACHHQKMVIIDGHVAFLGGIDLCYERWSDRSHQSYFPNRKNHQGSHPPAFHDIQAYITGPAVDSLTELFAQEWSRTGGEPFDFAPDLSSQPDDFKPTAPILTKNVAFCRTRAKTLFPPQNPVTEIRQMYVDAIQSADKLIYIENQYFTSQAVLMALVERLRKKDRPRLEIVLILPRLMKTIPEDLALGFLQARLLRCLKKVAGQTGHALGIYYSTTRGKNGEKVPTTIHSKLFLVDDRFLSVGSANLANRSMGLDTELNAAWEGPMEDEPNASVRKIRIDLLAEHTGMPQSWAADHFHDISGLVQVLDALARSKKSGLFMHPMTTRFRWLRALFSHGINFDPEKPLIEEKITGWLKAMKARRKLWPTGQAGGMS